MPKNNNAAYRIYKIMEKVSSNSNDRQMLSVWADVFSVKPDNGLKRNYEIARKLGLLHDELQTARAAMQSSTFSSDLYDRAFNNSEIVMQVEGLTNQLNSYRHHLSADYFVSLKFCAELLPHEEDDLTEAQLDDLLADVESLIQKVNDGALPEYVKDFVIRQVSYIVQAVFDYQIIGAKAFKQAINKSFVEVIENEEVIKEHKDSEEITTLSRIWQTTVKYGGTALKIGSYLSAGAKLIEMGIKVAEHLP